MWAVRLLSRCRSLGVSDSTVVRASCESGFASYLRGDLDETTLELSPGQFPAADACWSGSAR